MKNECLFASRVSTFIFNLFWTPKRLRNEGRRSSESAPETGSKSGAEKVRKKSGPGAHLHAKPVAQAGQGDAQGRSGWVRAGCDGFVAAR